MTPCGIGLPGGPAGQAKRLYFTMGSVLLFYYLWVPRPITITATCRASCLLYPQNGLYVSFAASCAVRTANHHPCLLFPHKSSAYKYTLYSLTVSHKPSSLSDPLYLAKCNVIPHHPTSASVSSTTMASPIYSPQPCSRISPTSSVASGNSRSHRPRLSISGSRIKRQNSSSKPSNVYPIVRLLLLLPLQRDGEKRSCNLRAGKAIRRLWTDRSSRALRRRG